MLNNLHEFEPGIYRSDQPRTPEDWDRFYDLGVWRVIKLNSEKECRDVGWKERGMELVSFPMGDQEILKEMDLDKLKDLVGKIEKGTVVHCLRGRDRTGLVVAAYRMLVQGWSMDKARAEALRYGYTPIFPGLEKAFSDIAAQSVEIWKERPKDAWTFKALDNSKTIHSAPKYRKVYP